MILVLDNRDSYTYNLVQLLRRGDREVRVVGADDGDEALRLLASGAVTGVVISPGPGHPDRDDDFAASGALIDAVLAGDATRPIPLLGVCLGHQGLARRSGYEVVAAPRPRHGWLSPLEHDGTGLFRGLPQGMRVTRYHSLQIVPGAVPDPALRVTARSEDGVIQAFEIAGRPWFGVQFHPESIATEHGAELVAAFTHIVDDCRARASGGASVDRAAAVADADAAVVADAAPAPAAATDGDAGARRAAGAVVEPPMQPGERDAWRLATRVIDAPMGLDTAAAARTLARAWSRRGAGSFWLDSALPDADGTHWSVVGDAVDVVGEGDAGLLRWRDGSVSIDRWASDADGTVPTTNAAPCADPFGELAASLAAGRVEGGDGLPFRGGLIGFLGYELGLRELRVDAARIAAAATPDAAWVRPARFAVLDHVAGTVTVAVIGRDASAVARALEREAARATAVLRDARSNEDASGSADGGAASSGAPGPGMPDQAMPDRATPDQGRRDSDAPGTVVADDLAPGTWRDDRAAYRAKIEACRRALVAGDSYELCLTTAFDVDPALAIDPIELFVDLVEHHPTPYAALLEFDDRDAGGGSSLVAIVSASPERFLRGRPCDGAIPGATRGGTEHGGSPTGEPGGTGGDWTTCDIRYETKPIKGTARRDSDPAVDAALARELATDPKTFAENLMIVDLLRNDLGRVCRTGSIGVPSLMRVESYASVHQLVSTVTGVAAAGTHPVDVVRALYPGGSMTGAPKLRSVELLAELEGRPRGVYSGALGILGADGRTELSIVIRTAVLAAGRWSIGAGGAIVLDSDPDAEYDEALLKASAIRRAIARVARAPSPGDPASPARAPDDA